MNHTIETYVTSRDSGDRLSRKAPGAFKEDRDGIENNLVNVYDDVTYQDIIGFGGAFTEAAAVTWMKLPEKKRDALMKAYFSPTEGQGYTFCRTHMNSCDFSTGNYASADVPGDYELRHFTIDRDRQAMVPMMKAAARHGAFKLFVSPWSPPAWMKDSGRMNQGGKLLPECRAAWALHFARFIQAYRSEGIETWGVTVQNEPKAVQTWDSCIYTAEEERDFVKAHLGPTLRAEGLGHVKIMIWDHNKERLFERAKVAFEDPEASAFLWGAGFHWYSGDHFEALDAVRARWPDKGLVFTEGAVGLKEGIGAWENAEQYGHDMIGNLNGGTNAWCEWNMILDERGGPNHVGNYCEAPVIVHTDTGSIEYKPSWYYIGHFSRFITPGSVRLCCTRCTDKVECTAFRTPRGERVLVAMNRGDRAVGFTLRHAERVAPVEIPGHGIVTLRWGGR